MRWRQRPCEDDYGADSDDDHIGCCECDGSGNAMVLNQLGICVASSHSGAQIDHVFPRDLEDPPEELQDPFQGCLKDPREIHEDLQDSWQKSDYSYRTA